MSATAEKTEGVLEATGWVRLERLDPQTFGAMFESYSASLPDQTDWCQFAMNVSSALVFVSAVGWMKFDNFIEGASLEFHGAKWKWHEDPVNPRWIRMVLEEVMERTGVRTILAKIPTRARAARLFVVRVGFDRAGVIPDAVTFNNMGEDLHVFALRRRK